MSDGLSESQLVAMVITERVNSCLSLLGILFVMVTYLYHSSFDKPINRLIFFASIGNMGSNIAALISLDGPVAGTTSSLCQFQAFLVQMFLGVDCYWAFCMAINVYLVFFRGYTTRQLRQLDIWYLLACYGLSFIPALVFLFVSTPEKGKVYGPAIIWCWITTDWDWARVVFLYGIVWVAVLFAFVVYGMAGKVIWDKRAHLDGFLNPLKENPFANTVTTEIEITHEVRSISNDEEGPARGFSDMSCDGNDPYSVEVRVDQNNPNANRSLPAALRMRTLTRDAAERETNTEAWLYARVAFLFFIALLITWTPTSANRMYALARPNAPLNFALNYVASFLFPLQGFWNVLVYISSSQTAVRRFFYDLFGNRRAPNFSAPRRRPSSLSSALKKSGDIPRMAFPSAAWSSKQRLQSISSQNEH